MDNGTGQEPHGNEVEDREPILNEKESDSSTPEPADTERELINELQADRLESAELRRATNRLTYATIGLLGATGLLVVITVTEAVSKAPLS